MPFSYATRFRDGVSGRVAIERLPGAGHLAELDAPALVAESIIKFLR